MIDAAAAVAEFDRHFMEIVDALCAAAQYGRTDPADARYAASRGEALRAYARAARHLAPHAPAGADPFRALLRHRTLAQALDDTGLTQDLYMCSAALDAWRTGAHTA